MVSIWLTIGLCLIAFVLGFVACIFVIIALTLGLIR
jgi:hypothetical protein